MDTNKLVAPDVQFMLILEKEENRSTRRKPSKYNRDQLRELSHMKHHPPDLVSVVRGTTR